MGIVLIGLSVIFQPLLGLLAHVMYDPDRKRVPIFPDMIHQAFGYILILFAAATIFNGLYEYGADNDLFIIAGVWIGLSMVAVVLLIIVEATKVKAMNKETEENDVDTTARNILFFLLGFLILGGLIAVGVFTGYLWNENDTNVITLYN